MGWQINKILRDNLWECNIFKARSEAGNYQNLGKRTPFLFRMTVRDQVHDYIASLPASKSSDMQALHGRIREIMPGARLWFLDGKNSENKIVSNPNIGYGLYNRPYLGAGPGGRGKIKEFYQIGMSANTTGISVYIMGIPDKTYLVKNYGDKIGRAMVTGYCIKFKSLKDININVLEAAIRYGVEESGRG